MSACSDTQKRLRALLDGELAQGDRRRVLEHMHRCPQCEAAHSRMQSVVEMVRDQVLEEPPPHFAANLQVRLASASRSRWPWWRRFVPEAVPRRRWAGATALVAVATLAVYLGFGQRMSVAEIADRAANAWRGVRNYSCQFVSTGVYQGRHREFRQTQWYQRPGLFRLETEQDYPLTTYIDAKKVTHYIQGASWQGKGPLVIIRPRVEGEEALPFPFGITWNAGGNVSIDQLVRQLGNSQDAKRLPNERVGDRLCYHIQFTAVPPGGRRPDQYEMWIDRKRFLPLKVSWTHDANNFIVTEAKELVVNATALPRETFEYQPSRGDFIVHGDVDPHTFALPPTRLAEFDSHPQLAARNEMVDRAEFVQFTPVCPSYIPAGFKLVRVRRSTGRWVDAHWIDDRNPSAARIIKLQQQLKSLADEPADRGKRVKLPGGKNRSAWVVSGRKPYPYVYVRTDLAETRVLLFLSGISRREALKVAASLTPVPAYRQAIPSDETVTVHEMIVLGAPADLIEEAPELPTPDDQFVDVSFEDMQPQNMMPDTGDPEEFVTENESNEQP